MTTKLTNCYLFQSYAVAKKDLKEFTKDHAAKNDDKTIKAGVLHFAPKVNTGSKR